MFFQFLSISFIKELHHIVEYGQDIENDDANPKKATDLILHERPPESTVSLVYDAHQALYIFSYSTNSIFQNLFVYLDSIHTTMFLFLQFFPATYISIKSGAKRQYQSLTCMITSEKSYFGMKLPVQKHPTVKLDSTETHLVQVDEKIL